MKLYSPQLSSTQRSVQCFECYYPVLHVDLHSPEAHSHSWADLLETVWIRCPLPVPLITLNLLIKAEKMEFTAAFKSGDNHTIDGVVSVYSETSVLPEI